MSRETKKQKAGRIQAEVHDQEYEVVSVERLQEHPQNPRRGSVEAIDESMDLNGWYGAVVAQKSTGYILAGNHRYRTARKRGAGAIPCIWRDVDDDAALRILLADNRTADLGGYDEETLTEVLSSLETLDGTGWGLDPIEVAEEADEGAGEGDDEIPDDEYTPEYAVIVVCKTEDSQESVYEQLQKAAEKGKLPDDAEVRVTAV